MKLVLVGFGLLLVGFVLLLVAAMVASPGGKGNGTPTSPPPSISAPPPTAAPAEPPRKSIELGGEVLLGTDDGKLLQLAVDDDAWDKMLDAQVAGDDAGIHELARAGKVILVKGGVRGKVIKTGFASIRVRVLDGPKAGESGWLQRELVSPMPELPAEPAAEAEAAELPKVAEVGTPARPSARREEELRRTVEKRKARAAAGARNLAGARASYGAAMESAADAANGGGFTPSGTTTGPRGGVYHIGANGQKVYEKKP